MATVHTEPGAAAYRREILRGKWLPIRRSTGDKCWRATGINVEEVL